MRDVTARPSPASEVAAFALVTALVDRRDTEAAALLAGADDLAEVAIVLARAWMAEAWHHDPAGYRALLHRMAASVLDDRVKDPA